MKRSSIGGVVLVCQTSDGFQAALLVWNDWLFGKQLLINIEKKSNIINVDASFRHANHSAAFVVWQASAIPQFQISSI